MTLNHAHVINLELTMALWKLNLLEFSALVLVVIGEIIALPFPLNDVAIFVPDQLLYLVEVIPKKGNWLDIEIASFLLIHFSVNK